MNDLLGQAARQYAARDYRATETVCRTIIGADPRHFDALHLLGVVLTLQERTAGGETVPGSPGGIASRRPGRVAGKRVLILIEQGRGDMLQCIRYAPLLAERGATVLVQAYPDLVPLLAAMPAETLAPLLALPGFEFHCLQKEIAESDRAWLNAARPPFNLHVHRLGDFADTAALAVQINVIVTIDTAVAHLGGALGLPVHLMLPSNPDRRWMLARPDSR